MRLFCLRLSLDWDGLSLDEDMAALLVGELDVTRSQVAMRSDESAVAS